MSRAPARGSGQRPRRAGPPKPRVVTPPQRRRMPGWRAQVGEALGRLPIPHDLLRRIRNWTLGLFLTAGIVAGVLAMGVPQMIGLSAAHGLGRAGFVVRTIQFEGHAPVDPQRVYDIVNDAAKGQDMPLVDLAGIRARLLQLGWIAEARVSRRLPDTLVVGIVERVPAAILQRHGALSLVDVDGHILGPVDPRRLPLQLPLLLGWNAERHVASLQALLASERALGKLVTDATWVGDRRWDLRFQSGETLALPEGDGPARDALGVFSRKDGTERLLARGYAHFDMRLPGQLVVRTSREPGARIEDPPPAPPPGTLPPNAA